MRMDILISRLEEKIRTTEFKLLGESPPMDKFFVNTEILSAFPSDMVVLLLSISDRPFAAGEVALSIPPVPFYKAFTRVVRYEHRVVRRGKERRAPNTPNLPVNLAYMNRSALDAEFVAQKKPIYFGLSPIQAPVIEDENQTTANDGGGGDEIARADALAALDEFLRDSVRVKRGARLTSRQVWAVWAKYHKADPRTTIIRGIRLTDIARRFRAVFGVIMVENSTRIDGIHQRYWDGYIITSPSP